MRPVKNNVLVKPFPPDEISEGGIIVADSCKQVSNKVKIVAVGEGTKSKPMYFKPGDVGFRVKDWGEPIEIDGELHFIMESSAIICLQ